MATRKLVMLIIAGLVINSNGTSLRRKRSLYNFGVMVEKSGLPGLKINGYGNYCGFGGDGQIKDPFDQCCKDHDNCWGQSRSLCPLSPYVTYYPWERINGSIVCGSVGKCRTMLCECDKVAVECFIANAHYLVSASANKRIYPGFITSLLTVLTVCR